MRQLYTKFRVMAFAAAAMAAVAIVPGARVLGDSLPTGEVVFGRSQIEPAYDDLTGNLMYLLTPLGTPVVDPTNIHGVAPLYIIVYPTSAGSSIGTVNCQHQPMDNCPDHGPEIAGFAEGNMPSVYGGGVWGHDHIGTGHPSTPPAGGDYNTAWVPTVVLFKDAVTANTHVTTLAQLNNLITNQKVTVTPLWAATFQCSPVSVKVYNLGTPVASAPPVP